MDAAMRILAGLFTDCLTAGVATDDLAVTVKWALDHDALTVAKVNHTVTVLQRRLNAAEVAA